MNRLLFFLLPIFIFGCSENSTSTPAEREVLSPTTTSIDYRPMLVIGVEFNDYNFSSSISTWENKIFGTSQSTVNHYYDEISAQQFQFSPVTNNSVSSGMTLIKLNQNHPNFYSGQNLSAWINDIKTRLYPILEQALIQVDTNGFDFSIYDTNHDGKVTPNELIIMYILAGEEDAYSGGMYASGIWAHVDCTTSSYSFDGVNLLGCGSGGKYAVFGERHYDSTTNSHDATIGIIAHELGHATFDLPDLYYGSSTRIGYYGLMANGSWGQADITGEAGDTPTHMCAWSKIESGWYDTSSSSDTTLSVHATGTTDYNIIKVPINGNPDEYFLVENRGDFGYDTGLKDINNAYVGGMAIWHIDETIIRNKRAANEVNIDPYHKGVDLEEAAGPSVDSGNGDPALNLYYTGNVTTFTPTTTPNTDSYTGDSSFIYFSDISSPSSTMSVTISK